ncbi:MAG: pirin family protein [Helicobacteraceae bacterium]|jgi:redox-sensitive bicupin YhaK (pirin superfamily)|nr:pirin family protein [Helicobacteraceae bacterium]
MTKRIDFNRLYLSDQGWLQSRFHFSFAEYYNPSNIHYGALRVMNDDIVQPRNGFGTHPHRDMEIFSYVLDGELTHADSMGNVETLRRGDMQYMSAGTGIWHSEMNETDKPIRFIQTWIMPDRAGITPRYGSARFDKEQRRNKWLCMIGNEEAVSLNQDVSVYVSELESGGDLKLSIRGDRLGYVKVMEGSADINGVSLQRGDAAMIESEPIAIKAMSDAHIMAIEVARLKR